MLEQTAPTANKRNFTTIDHVARKALGLTANEYMVADLIYNLSNNPDSRFPGWCYASKEFIASQLGLTRKQIHVIIKKLASLELLEKEEPTKFIKTTSKWYGRVVITDTNERLHSVTKSYEDSNQKLLEDTNERLHYNDTNNNDNNNVLTKVNTEFGNSVVNDVSIYFLQRLGIPKEDCTQKQSRQYWSLLLKESNTGADGVKWLIDLAADDKWYRNHITSSKDLYYKRIKLVAAKRGTAPRVAVMES